MTRTDSKISAIRWIYDSNNTENQNAAIAPLENQLPETAILYQLLELASNPELDGTIEAGAPLLQNANTAALSREITRLAGACEFKQQQAFIQHYLA